MTATEKKLILGRRRFQESLPAFTALAFTLQKVGGSFSITEAAEGILLTSEFVSSYAVTEYLTENLQRKKKGCYGSWFQKAQSMVAKTHVLGQNTSLWQEHVAEALHHAVDKKQPPRKFHQALKFQSRARGWRDVVVVKCTDRSTFYMLLRLSDSEEGL